MLKMALGEYNSLLENPADGKVVSMTTGTSMPVTGPFGKVVDLAGGLHTQYIVDDAANAWSYDDASKTTSLSPVARNVFKVVGNPTGGSPAIIKNDGTLWIGAVQVFFPVGAGMIKDVWMTANGAIYAVDSLGNVYSWGFYGYGANWVLMQGSNTTNSTAPTKVPLPGPVKAICAHNEGVHFLLQNGQLYAGGIDPRYYGFALGQITTPIAPIRVDQFYKFPAPIQQISTGYMTTYAILTDGSMWAWGENTSGTVGNGQETNMKATNPTYSAPWYNSAPWILPSSQGGALFVPLPVQIGKGITWAYVNRGCYNWYQAAEDVNGNLYTWGRNKSGVLMNGVVGTSDQQANQPNLWDVTSPTLVQPFGSVVVPPVNKNPLAAIAQIPPVTLPMNVVLLDGSASVDPDGTIAAYAWSQISGPLAAILGSGSKVQALVSLPGTYVFQLTVTDNQGATDFAQISVILNAVPACPPIPAPRTVTAVTATINGQSYPMPIPWLKFTFNDGTTQ